MDRPYNQILQDVPTLALLQELEKRKGVDFEYMGEADGYEEGEEWVSIGVNDPEIVRAVRNRHDSLKGVKT
jgi:hypothetical protein